MSKDKKNKISHNAKPFNKFAKPENSRYVIKRLLDYVGQNKMFLIIGLVAASLGSLAEVLANAFLIPIINTFVYEKSFSAAIPSMVGMAVVFLLGAGLSYLGSRLMVVVAQKTSHVIRQDLFNRVQEMPMQFFDTHPRGELMSTFTNDVDNISMALDQTLINLLMSAVTIITTFVMMMRISPFFTFLVILITFIVMLLVGFIMGMSRKAFQKQQKDLADINSFSEEMTEGQKVVKVFNHEGPSIEVFEKLNEDLRQASTDAQTFAVIIMPIMGNMGYIQYALIAMLGAMRIINGQMDIGSLTAFLQYTRNFSRPLIQISNQLNMLIAALAGAERVFKLMDQDIEVDDGDVTLVRISDKPLQEISKTEIIERGNKNHLPLRYLPEVVAGQRQLVWHIPGSQDQAEQYIPVCADIRFHDVNFSYVEGKPVLQNISLYAKPGQRIALVGSTGAGKTTITNLINRFYDIQEGEITIDGIDIKRIKKDHLRLMLGMVLQEVHLFTGSVADNIRYGKLNATEEEVIEAAKFANADHFIRHLPEGYDTILEDDGTALSQGQRQLISIARAAISDPLILILDEATSSVDTRTERLIQRGMDNMMQGRTTFAIAHRLSTVRHANAIMVMEQGEIIERGDHDDLMALKGRYFALNMGMLELD